MKPSTFLMSALVVPMAGNLFAQDEAGFEWGGFTVSPEVSVLGAYDDRVNRSGASADDDFYADTEARIAIANLPARYNLFASALYGYRFYNDYSSFDDDFYKLKAAVGSGDEIFQWGFSSDYTKSLSYNVSYDPATGQQPDSILTDSSNIRWLTQGNISYNKPITERTSIRPGYGVTHYYQEFQAARTEEWQDHEVNLQVRHKYSDRTVIYSGASAGMQANGDENGFIGTAVVGVEGRTGDKIGWKGEVGYSLADYETSGQDEGVIANLKGTWQLTEKISVYTFGGNDFQPGYSGGGARWVYRLGYGLGWQALEKLSFGASALHDYQEEIGGGNVANNPALGTLRSFFTLSADYQLNTRLLIGAGYRYANDEFPTDQQVISFRAACRF